MKNKNLEKSKKKFYKKRIVKKNKTKKHNRLNKKLLTKKHKKKNNSLKKYSKKKNRKNNIRTKKLIGGALLTLDSYKQNLGKIDYVFYQDIYDKECNKQQNLISSVNNKNSNEIDIIDISSIKNLPILRKLGLFPFIVSIIAIDNEKIYFEKCNGKLDNLLQREIRNQAYTNFNNQDNSPDSNIINACLDIAYAIQYLHDKNILHRYICKNNISYIKNVDQYLFKLGNFEYAVELQRHIYEYANNPNFLEYYEIELNDELPSNEAYYPPEVKDGLKYNNNNNDNLIYEIPVNRDIKRYYKQSDLFSYGKIIESFTNTDKNMYNQIDQTISLKQIGQNLTKDNYQDRTNLEEVIIYLKHLLEPRRFEISEKTENQYSHLEHKQSNKNNEEYKTPSNIARNEKTFNYNERIKKHIEKHIEKQSPKVHGNKNPEKTEEDLEFEVEGLIFELFTDILPNTNYKDLDELLNEIKKKLNFLKKKKVFEENTKITEKEKEEIIKSPNFKTFIENYMNKINSIKEEYQKNLELDRIYLLLIILHKELRTKDENGNFVKIEFPPEIKIITDAICSKLLQEQTISYIKKKLPKLTDEEIIDSDLFKYGKYLEYIQGSDEDGITDIDILKNEEMDILKFQKGKGLPPKIVIDTQGSEKKNLQPDVYYDTGIKLGGGQFGDVYKGTLTLNKNPIVVAVKVVKSDIPDENYKKKENEDLLEEAKLMSKLGIHPNIVSLIGIHKEQEKPEEPNKVCIQFCENGSLLSYLLKSEKITEKELIKICKHIANGMEYIVSKNIVHRDLAARNILVSQYNTFKVSDFGMSRKMGLNNSQNKYTYTEKGPIELPLRWCDPELLKKGNKIFSEGTDVWSFGIVMIEILQKGKTPYTNMNNIQVIQYISSGNRISKPENCSDAIYDIIKNCWKESPTDRYTFKTIKEELKNIKATEKVITTVETSEPIKPVNPHEPNMITNQ